MSQNLIEIVLKGSFDQFVSFWADLSPEAQKEQLLSPLKDGMNILHLCCSQGYTKHVQHVLAVAEKHFVLRDFVDARTADEKFGCSALFFAIRMGHGGF